MDLNSHNNNNNGIYVKIMINKTPHEMRLILRFSIDHLHMNGKKSWCGME